MADILPFVRAHVEEYNFGTLLRLDCKEGYSEANTTLVPRVQFLAIEIARNRQGLNMCHFGKDPNPKPATEVADTTEAAPGAEDNNEGQEPEEGSDKVEESYDKSEEPENVEPPSA